jgi:hypothetical protein
VGFFHSAAGRKKALGRQQRFGMFKRTDHFETAYRKLNR